MRKRNDLPPKSIVSEFVFEAVTDIVCILTPDAKIIDINENIEKYGYKREKLKDRAFMEFFSKDDQDKARLAIIEKRELARPRKNEKFENYQQISLPLLCPHSKLADENEKEFTVLSISTIRVHEGEAVKKNHLFTLCIAKEIPKPLRRLPSDTLNHSKTDEIEYRNQPEGRSKGNQCNNETISISLLLFSSLLHTSPVGMMIADAPDANISFINKAAYKVIGCENFSHEDIVDAYHPKNWLLFRTDGSPYLKEEYPLVQSVVHGKSIVDQVAIVRRPDGEDCFIKYNAAPMLNNENEIYGGLLVFYDITAERKNEKEKQILEYQLIQAQKMGAIGTLSSGFAHNFNNLLLPIYTYAQLLERKLGNENNSLLKYTSGIMTAASKASDLVSQILKIGRGIETEKSIIDILPVIKETLRLLRSAIPSSIEIVTAFNAKKTNIYCNVTQLHQVFMNLGINAAQSLKDNDGILEVKVSNYRETETNDGIRKGDYVLVEFRDNGRGIEPKILEKIFEPFFTTKETGRGTGLGLFMAYKTIKSLGGYIHPCSELGKGSTFLVYLPLLAKQPD